MSTTCTFRRPNLKTRRCLPPRRPSRRLRHRADPHPRPRPRVRCWLAALPLLLGAAACVHRPAPPVAQPLPSYERVVAQFQVAAFGSDFSDREVPLSRWIGHIRWRADLPDNAMAAEIRRALPRHMADITAATGIRFREVDGQAKAEVTIALAPRRAFAARLADLMTENPEVTHLAHDSACNAVYMVFGGTMIYRSRILIGADIPASLRRDCVLEEVVQAMGLPADACHYRPSLFCEADRVYRLHGPDAILLRTLYDPRLTPGMSRAEAMPIAREIIWELWLEYQGFRRPNLMV